MRDVGSKSKTKKGAQDRDLKKGNSKFVPITREDLAREAFEVEFIVDYYEKHPDVKWLPEDEKRKMKEEFDQLVKTTNSKIVEDYHEKYPLELFNCNPFYKANLIDQLKKIQESNIIEVNRDVAEASSKSTMNQNKRISTNTQRVLVEASSIHHESEQNEEHHYSDKSKISEGHLEKLTAEFEMLVA